MAEKMKGTNTFSAMELYLRTHRDVLSKMIRSSYFAIIYGQEAKLDASLQETDQKLQKIPQSWGAVRKHITEEPLLTEMFCSYLKELCAKRCEVSRDLARFNIVYDYLSGNAEKKAEHMIYTRFLENQRRLFKDDTICQAAEVADPHGVDVLLQICGLRLGGNTWTGNGDRYTTDGTVPFMGLPAFREDVYDILLLHIEHSNFAEPELAETVTKNARRGIFQAFEMDAFTEKQLISIGLPAWVIEYLKNVTYLPRRDSGLAALCTELGDLVTAAE